ncbi:hypothetical protein [Parvibacter caecicola]|uniref:hypothetical protein n=1 Tax=Parvibacter caecicola TaxID=747645 RepID=UPI0027301E30|nr:hypothetical protein [Parvibacter caecicola]
MAEAVKTSEMRELLRKRFGDTARYALAEEVADTTGWASRRLDMVVCSCWESDGFLIEGIEIKVSKSDLKHELENPHKHDVFFGDLDFYSLAAPREVINGMDGMIPKTWGLYEAYRRKDGELALKCRRRPVSIEGGRGKVSRRFFASLVRNLYACSPSHRLVLEAERRGYGKGLKDGPDSNGWRIASLERDLKKAQREIAEWRAFYFCDGGWHQGPEAVRARAEQLKKVEAIHNPDWTERELRNAAKQIAKIADFVFGEADPC